MRKVVLFLLLFLYSFSFSQWSSLNSGTTQNLRSIHFINTQTGFACGLQGTIIKTTNGGLNWSLQNSGLAYELRSVYFLNSTTGLICGFNGTILRTTDAGNNWELIPSGTTTQLLSLSFTNNLNGVCAGNSGVTLYTTNGGLNWLTGQPIGYLVTFYCSYMLNAQTGYCGGVNTIFSPLFAKTTNGGANWVYSTFYVNSNEATLHDIYFFNEQNGLAVSFLWNGQGGISRTTNGGANWTHEIFTPALYGVDFTDANTGYIAGFNGTILKSTNGGINWTPQITGSTAFLRTVDFLDSLNGYAAGDGGVILKTTNGGVVAVEPVSNIFPERIELFQNYPNPFNPVTKIKFSLPHPIEGGAIDVKLIIYDAIGREVASLIPQGQEGLQSGTYEVEFDCSNYSSGVYYYTLTAGDYTITKKMVLLK